ncbi:MAG: hypothetical protein GY943_37310 [Chloroflexi bacterium]|nr:hypothetical protein [Chloroflexota bacterium]
MGSLSRLLKLPWLDTHYLITGGSGMILLSLIGFELIIGRPKLGYPIPVNEGRKIILGAWFIIAGAGFLMIPIENYLSIFPVPVNSIFTIGLILLLAFLTNKLHKQQKQSISSDG